MLLPAGVKRGGEVAVAGPVNLADPGAQPSKGAAASDGGRPGWEAAADIRDKEALMTCVNVARRLENSGSLAVLLDAAYDAFEEMIAIIRGHEDSDEGFFAGLAFAAAAAADGRDAILTASSLPPTPAGKQPAGGSPGLGAGAAEMAAEVAALSRLLAARLAHAAELAASPQDRLACRHGARSAQEISHLLAGT